MSVRPMPDRSPSELLEMIRKVLDEGPFSIEQLAEESGISYHTLYSWATSRRNPGVERLLQLADGLRRRGGHLNALADQLEVAAGPGAE